MKRLFLMLFPLIALLGCGSKGPLQGHWEFAYVRPIENIEHGEENETEAIGVSTLMMNIAMSDYEYSFDNGNVFMRHSETIDEPYKEVGAYDNMGNICLVQDDENYNWSFRYQIIGDSLYLTNEEIKIVYARQ